jgi:very-short-patch-repair endonuclease
VFCRSTAGWLHGLDTPACNPIEVTVHVDCYITRIAGVVVHRSKELEKWFAEGLPVTSPVRTVADLGCSLPLVDAVVIIDAALHRRLVKVNQLTSWVAEHKGHRGVRRLQRAIELAEPATESPMETRLRLLLVLGGLPKPKVQVRLYDEHRMLIGRPDLYYSQERLAIEYDGATHRDSLAADNRRQNRLLDAGYHLLRFTAADVLSAPDSVVSLVGRGLGHAIAP